MAILEMLLVGRTPLGSAVRAALIACLVNAFWTFFLSTRWQLFIVGLITTMAVTIAAHLFSRRDNPRQDPGV